MLSKLFAAPARLRAIRNAPEGSLVERFAERLILRGYAGITARRHIRSAEHLVRWVTRKGLDVRDIGDRELKVFADHLAHCRCGRYCCSKRLGIVGGARLFLNDVVGKEQPSIRDCEPVAHEPVLLSSFFAWMRERRGTSDAGLYNYSQPIRRLLRRINEDPSGLDARLLRQFVLKESQRGRWAARRCRTALRMFLRFMIAEGRCRAGLLGAIPVVPHWRLAPLPRPLSAEDVERLIASCDCSSSIGRRDRAILLLLARLGLRAGDIVAMCLSDVDWKGAWVHVSGKNRRQVRLPLTREVGQAVVAYIRDGRPRADTDGLFLRSRAPYRPFANHCAVSVIVAKAMQRAGVERPGRGAAHLLRHSVASSMLRRGASLQEISTLLRHRSIETTQIYAKVDVVGLQQIAQPWPQVSPC
jgi:site-specific recombinase XerD